ncbi:MAG: conjugal transfer protein TraX [Eubacterium sp.]|nr:conjugal transfer protein TraX [Eubacterium sp.]
MNINKGLNGTELKLIAIVAMTIDHLTWTLAPGYSTVWWVIALHLIGRLTAPIMWFFIAEGYHYTRNKKQYALRLFVLAIVSHFAYNFCFGIQFVPLKDSIFNQTSVAWSLLGGLIVLCINDSKKLKNWHKIILIVLICVVTFCSDWSCIAVMAIFGIGTNRGNFKKQMISIMIWTTFYAIVYFLFIDKLYGILQLGVCLSIPVLKMYNGERGKFKRMGKLFYIYYPLHLFICGIIRVLIA